MTKPPTPSGPRVPLSRRAFLGSAAAALAVAGGGLGAAASRAAPPGVPGAVADPRLLRDYVGRLCYNENPLGPAPAAAAALVASVAMGHRYPDWYAESLRDALASLHGVSRAQVIAGCGATEILRLAAHAAVTPGCNVVSPYPSYGQFPADCGFLGAQVRYADLDAEYRVDPAAILAEVDGDTTAVCLTNPNNPTGPVLSAAAVEALASALPGHVDLIVDEAYHEYIHDPGYASAMGLVLAGGNAIVIRTFSKVFGLAGVRIGYAVGPASRIQTMAAWQLYATVSRPALEAAIAGLGDTQHVADTVALNDQAKQYAYTELAALGLAVIPSETNFFMVDVGGPSGPIADELAARGIYVRTGWGMPNHLRVSTGTMAEMETFATAMGEIFAAARAPDSGLPRLTALHANHPNPFAHATRLSCALAQAGDLRLEVFSVEGRRVRSLAAGRFPAGWHRFAWDGRDDRGRTLASGSYFCRMTAGETVQTRRMILVR